MNKTAALNQACQTQTTSRAAKAIKTTKGAAKVQSGPHFTKNYSFLILKIVIFIQNYVK